MELLKNQIKIRNKLLAKPTKILFSIAGAPKNSDQLLQEVLEVLQRETSQKRPGNSTVNSREKKKKQLATQYLTAPHELVGKDIVHRFANEETEMEEMWEGKIIAYNTSTNTHTVTYTEDTEQYNYDLTADINSGDLWVLL